MTKNFKQQLLALLALSIFLVGCSGEDDSPINEGNKDADVTTLTNFSFKKADNDGISSDISSKKNESIIYVTVPNSKSLTSLVPSFTIAKGATASINGTPIESGITPCDFSNTVTMLVTSESGKKSSYTILAKNGIAKVDNKVYDFMIKYKIPGASVAISTDEAIAYKAGYGFAVTENKIRVTPRTLFRLASMSKQQTAFGIMALYEKGLLSIDDKVFGEGAILEEEFGTDILPEVKDITVKHLLQHTSGWDIDPIYTGATTSLEERIKEMITLQKNAPKYKVGTTFDYNNLNFCILGKIIETLSGTDYETFLHEEVHAKASISNIFVGKNSPNNRRANECKYYGQDGRNPYGNDVEMSKAAGGMIACTEELMILMNHIDYGTKVPDIFKKETLDMMYTPYKEGGSYALGWRTNHTTLTNWATHHGGTLAGVSTIWSRGKDGTHGVVLCNSRSYKSGFDTAMWLMLEDIQQMF